MRTLENSSIALKDLDPDYLDDMFEYARDERVGGSAGWPPHKDSNETLELMNMYIKTEEVWGIYHKADNKLIGTIGIHKGKHPITKEHVHAMGFELNPSYWGKGIMATSCDLLLDHYFGEMNGKEIYANHFDFNTRSKHFIIKYGMVFESNWHRSSKNIDNSLYRMTKADYNKKRCR